MSSCHPHPSLPGTGSGQERAPHPIDGPTLWEIEDGALIFHLRLDRLTHLVASMVGASAGALGRDEPLLHSNPRAQSLGWAALPPDHCWPRLAPRGRAGFSPQGDGSRNVAPLSPVDFAVSRGGSLDAGQPWGRRPRPCPRAAPEAAPLVPLRAPPGDLLTLAPFLLPCSRLLRRNPPRVDSRTVMRAEGSLWGHSSGIWEESPPLCFLQGRGWRTGFPLQPPEVGESGGTGPFSSSERV